MTSSLYVSSKAPRIKEQLGLPDSPTYITGLEDLDSADYPASGILIWDIRRLDFEQVRKIIIKILSVSQVRLILALDRKELDLPPWRFLPPLLQLGVCDIIEFPTFTEMVEVTLETIKNHCDEAPNIKKGLLHDFALTGCQVEEPIGERVFSVQWPHLKDVLKQPRPLLDPIEMTGLLVEDERALADSLQQFLTGIGYDMSVAYNGAAVSEFLTQPDKPLDIIVLDVQLPDTTGNKLVQPLRKAYPHAAIVMLTAYEDCDLIVNTIQAGADLHLVKSAVDPDHLHQALNDMLYAHWLFQQVDIN